MLVPLTLALAAAVATAVPASDPALRTPMPGPEGGVAFRSISAGRIGEGCSSFLAQIRAGTRDPWTYMGAVHCLSLIEGYGNALWEGLASRPEDDALALFGRGLFHFEQARFEQAEQALRQAVAREKDLALAWSYLGSALFKRGDHAASIPMFEEALRLTPELDSTRISLRDARLRAGVFDRLLALLAAIPRRWTDIPAPRVPVSGRPPAEVNESSAPEDRRQAYAFLARLAQSEPEERPAKIRERLKGPPPTEVDLWWPGVVLRELPGRMIPKGEGAGVPAEAAMAIEAWLQWAEALGRRDALLYAAAQGVNLLAQRTDSGALVPVARAWATLLPATSLEGGIPYGLLKESYAAALDAANRFEDALQVHRDVRTYYQTIGAREELAASWLSEAAIWRSLRKPDEALRAYGEAHRLAEAAGEDQTLGLALLGEADIFLHRVEDERALEAFRRARPLLEKFQDVKGQGRAWSGEGEILWRLNRPAEALQAYTKARSLYESAHDERGLGHTLNGEAEILRVQGDHETARRKYRQARALFEAIGDEVGLSKAWLGESTLRANLGDSETALAMLRQARAYAEKADDEVSLGNVWLDEGDLLTRRKEDDQALQAYREARRYCELSGDRMGQGRSWLGEAGIQARRGELQIALEALRKAIEVTTEQPQIRAHAVWSVAQIQTRLGKWHEVAENAELAAELFRQSEYTPGQVGALLQAQEAHAELGDLDGAAAAALEAIRLHAVSRRRWITDVHRTRGDVRISYAYDLLVPLRIQEGRYHEALTLAEEARSRALLDLLATGARSTQVRSSNELRDEKLRLQKERARIEREIAQTSAPEQRSELETERRRVDKELEWNRYEQAAEGSALLTSQPLDAEAIQALSQEIKSPILLYYAAASDLFGFLIRPDHAAPVVKTIAIPWLQLVAQAQTLAHDLANPAYQARPEARALARELWDRLIQPFVPDLPDRGTLVLVPHGPLHELPFEALLDPHDISLFRFWDVTVVPSVSALSFRRQRPAGPQPEDALLTFSSGSGLSLPEHEVARIAPFFHTVRPTEPLFSRYEEAAPGARYLFFATHGVHVEGNQSETYLELLPGEDHDSRLSAAEIAAVPLQAELVTLAACDTSHGTPLFSDERLGLTRSFLIAGVAAVLATRWQVPEDSSTSRFLEDFFRAYRQGGPNGKGLRKDQALSEARRLSQQRGDSAQLWAGWVLVGDPR